MERLDPGFARLPVHLLRQPPESPAALVSQGLPDLRRRLPDGLAPTRHGVQVGLARVFRAQHVPGHGLQRGTFLAPGLPRGMVWIEPAGLVLRQDRCLPRRDAAGEGAHLVRHRRLRRIGLAPFRHRAPYIGIEPLGYPWPP